MALSLTLGGLILSVGLPISCAVFVVAIFVVVIFVLQLRGFRRSNLRGDHFLFFSYVFGVAAIFVISIFVPHCCVFVVAIFVVIIFVLQLCVFVVAAIFVVIIFVLQGIHCTESVLVKVGAAVSKFLVRDESQQRRPCLRVSQCGRPLPLVIISCTVTGLAEKL